MQKVWVGVSSWMNSRCKMGFGSEVVVGTTKEDVVNKLFDTFYEKCVHDEDENVITPTEFIKNGCVLSTSEGSVVVKEVSINEVTSFGI